MKSDNPNSRANGPSKQFFDQSIVSRLSGAFKVITGKASAVDPGTSWMGPGNPINPIPSTEAQQASVTGRQFDYTPGYNLRITPRGDEAVSFGQMRALADNCDILRLVIETRKDQVEKLKFHIKPIDDTGKKDDRCKMVEEFFRSPDGENNWNSWVRELLEELFVTDAATIYPWLNNDGTPYRFELLDGTTIKRVLNPRGRTPAPPEPAYQQILKGIPAVDYTSDELIYQPRNRRVHKVYGYSPVEQIIMTVNIAIRRSLYQLQYYTEGSTPDLLFQVPPEWNMTQIKEFNDWWQDSLAGNTANRRKAQFVPHGVAPLNTKEVALKDGYDEWLAKIICYCFSVSAQAFTAQMNRATAETAQEMAIQEGLQPIMLWIKGVMDKLVWKYFGFKDLEFAWRDEKTISAIDQNRIDDVNLKNGSSSINEVRVRRGEKTIKGGEIPMVLTATGYVPVEYTPPEPMPNELAQNTNPEKEIPTKSGTPEKETEKPVGK